MEVTKEVNQTFYRFLTYLQELQDKNDVVFEVPEMEHLHYKPRDIDTPIVGYKLMFGTVTGWLFIFFENGPVIRYDYEQFQGGRRIGYVNSSKDIEDLLLDVLGVVD